MAEGLRYTDPLTLIDDPQQLRRELLSLSRLGRALVELIALSWEEVSAAPLQRAARELGITPRLAQEYQLGDLIAELEELAERGWLIDLGGDYRCHPELAGPVIQQLSAQAVRSYKRQTTRLSPSALQQALRGLAAEGHSALSAATIKVGRQLKRDLVIADKLGDESAALAIIWSLFESEALPRLWIGQCLRSLEAEQVERLPSAVRVWLRSELALSVIYQRPESTQDDPSSLEALRAQLKAIVEELSGRGDAPREQLSWLLRELIEGLTDERLNSRSARLPSQVRAAPLTCLESVCEALMIAGLLEGEPQRAPELLEAASELFNELKQERALRTQLGRRELDQTGRLRLWHCFAGLVRGDLSAATSAWSDGVRAFKRQSGGRLLGADAQLSRRLSALCLFAIKSPGPPNPLSLPSTSDALIELSELDLRGGRRESGVYVDELLSALPQPELGLAPARQHTLKAYCGAPLSPLWELLTLTALAWSGVTAEELSEYKAQLNERAERWAGLGWGSLAESVAALNPEVAPTLLSGLKEPTPEWLKRLNELETLAELLIQSHEGELPSDEL